MIIAVDFDGTIVEHKFPEIGEELPGAIETLNALQSSGHSIILWTCRGNEYLEQAVSWCHERGFFPNAVNKNIAEKPPGWSDPKVYADLYIDEKGIGCYIDECEFKGRINWHVIKYFLLDTSYWS